LLAGLFAALLSTGCAQLQTTTDYSQPTPSDGAQQADFQPASDDQPAVLAIEEDLQAAEDEKLFGIHPEDYQQEAMPNVFAMASSCPTRPTIPVYWRK